MLGAVIGDIAGIYYGIGEKNGIPEEWINKLAKYDWITGLIDKAIVLK